VQGGVWTAVEVLQAAGRAPFVLVCEHASRFIPPELDDLGLTEPALSAHIAWDIGARDMSVALAGLLDAPLVAGCISRLVYDCNRPFEAPDCIPATSEVFEIPGNQALDATVRKARHDAVHAPFHTALSDVIAAQQSRTGGTVSLITLHSFTPVYQGVPRDLELGFLCHANETLAQAALAIETKRGRYRAALNAPYAPSDGVTHTLAAQGEAKGLPALMIEVRNDLIDTPETARAMAVHLAETLRAAQPSVRTEAAQ
jgi:predicted N-formylglutamate amidohydrolase